MAIILYYSYRHYYYLKHPLRAKINFTVHALQLFDYSININKRSTIYHKLSMQLYVYLCVFVPFVLLGRTHTKIHIYTRIYLSKPEGACTTKNIYIDNVVMALENARLRNESIYGFSDNVALHYRILLLCISLSLFIQLSLPKHSFFPPAPLACLQLQFQKDKCNWWFHNCISVFFLSPCNSNCFILLQYSLFPFSFWDASLSELSHDSRHYRRHHP